VEARVAQQRVWEDPLPENATGTNGHDRTAQRSTALVVGAKNKSEEITHTWRKERGDKGRKVPRGVRVGGGGGGGGGGVGGVGP